MILKPAFIVSSLAFISLSLAGCSLLAKPEPVVLTEDPLAQFEANTEALGDTIALDNELRDVFNNTNSGSNLTGLYVYPMAGYTTHKTLKTFGQFIPESAGDRFKGYHTGDDIEVSDIAIEVPVYAITNAVVVNKQQVSGYGGMLILGFTDNGVTYHMLYGHLNLASVNAKIGEQVLAGQQLGVLGEDRSTETDGERKHLHFGLFPFNGTELIAGYVQDDAQLSNWVDPSTFLRDRQAIDAL